MGSALGRAAGEREIALRVIEEALERLALGLAVHGVALLEDAEVHVVGVELRAVDAGELALAPHQHPAAAVHAGAVHHDGVEADDRLDAQRLRDFGHGAHHGDGSDGEDPVDGLGREPPGELVGDQPFAATAAVVGGDEELIADRLHLLLQDHQLAGAPAEDAEDAVAGGFEGHGRRVGDGRADAASHHGDGAEALHLRGLAEGADHVEQGVSHLQVVEQLLGQASMSSGWRT